MTASLILAGIRVCHAGDCCYENCKQARKHLTLRLFLDMTRFKRYIKPYLHLFLLYLYFIILPDFV